LPVLGAGVALILMNAIYGDLDMTQLLLGLRQANPAWLLVLAGAILFEQVVNGWKWRQILHDVKPVRTLRLTGAMLAGYGANALVPLGISPLVRAWLIARMENLKMGTVLTTTVLARFIDGVTFALIAGLIAVAGKFPRIEGNLELGLGFAGALNLVLFGTLIWAMFHFRYLFSSDEPVISRVFDRVANWLRVDGAALRHSLCQGVVWPRDNIRKLNVFLGAVASKLVASTHFLWAGLALGVWLGPFDYLFLMVFAGFSMVLARFVRVPGGFVVGSAFALDLLGVASEHAVLMILFSYVMTIVVIVGGGLCVLWRSGIDIKQAQQAAKAGDADQ